MHLKKVAVPVRLPRTYRQRHPAGGRVRPKFIGGERAIYDEHLKALSGVLICITNIPGL